jgi:hypothetical protein
MTEPQPPRRTASSAGAIRLRLLAALVALAGGVTAIVIAILLVRTTLT